MEYDWRHRLTEDGDPVGDPGFRPQEWRAVDGVGEPLDILDVPSGLRTSVLNPLLTDEDVPGGAWLAIDAPPDGEVVLEYRREGEGPVLFEVLLRPAVVALESVPPATPDPTPAPTPSSGASVTDSELCATVDDYGVPGEATPAPTAAPWPSIAPEATPSSGVLQPGEVAVLGDEDGPGALMRISDPRICDRYPTARPWQSGVGYAVVRMEMLVLRDEYMDFWVDGSDRLRVLRAGDAYAFGVADVLSGVPGVHRRSSVSTPTGFEAVSDMVFAVPGGPSAELWVELRESEGTEPGGGSIADPPLVSWAIGTRPDRPPPADHFPDLSGPATTGRVLPGQAAVVDTGETRYGVLVGNVDQVERYPGVVPERGAFVEAFVNAVSADASGGQDPPVGSASWRAIGPDGEELAVRRLRDTGPEEHVMQPHATTTGPGWLIFDAPPEGEIVLEYRPAGEGPVLFEVLLRPG